ncbi:iron-containing redox enzyme family protein [Kitasatospora sp. NPDC059673]|uniref:iron-containing redox enzyme family protein n=1 Tax=Kitasatospora sp. NPDC059673 TaxID=3346901 RepID=UPI003696D369
MTAPPPPTAPPLPAPRGPLSAAVLAALGGSGRYALPSSAPVGDPWGDGLQLALYVCYELHYRGFAGVDDGWEWSPELLALRAELEAVFLAALRREVGRPAPLAEVLAGLLVDPPDGDGPSHHLLARGTRTQAGEYLAHRSLYHLKEADPQMWAVPRLPNPAKAALVAVQYDEYGAGRPERAHAQLFDPGGVLLLVRSSLADPDATVRRLRSAGLHTDITARKSQDPTSQRGSRRTSAR